MSVRYNWCTIWFNTQHPSYTLFAYISYALHKVTGIILQVNNIDMNVDNIDIWPNNEYWLYKKKSIWDG